ncbi:rCG56142, isoform CRA_a [Rattus norvegicus]|uniref:RCG56142, isoform CRA_a n=1 Tax=Rattus norvegicus TaxID=10116 RepID=A6IA56_RAT|nr:rCG56142, isoform CRA_a [Rattus norvegicus]EDL90974.1 rCG56142, isoform CRA_a [Rattus norvegicus]EDL90975.1 rCG56142, isoform CRA_a [Rattus norvegicus]EDL90976.1 rCG56142, isoform CRA_a [Rattus norvegicus]
MKVITSIPVRLFIRHHPHPSSRASTGMSVRPKGPEVPPAPQLLPIFPPKVLETSPQATYHCCGAPNLLPTSSSFLSLALIMLIFGEY